MYLTPRYRLLVVFKAELEARSWTIERACSYGPGAAICRREAVKWLVSVLKPRHIIIEAKGRVINLMLRFSFFNVPPKNTYLFLNLAPFTFVFYGRSINITRR